MNFFKRWAFGKMAKKFIKSRTRDKVEPRLNFIGIQKGESVLDYACGPGVYTWIIAEKVGSEGEVYAADINSEAEKYLKGLMQQHNLTNYKFILTDCKTGLADATIDTILLFDVYHHLKNPKEIITEFKRIIKSNGKLAVLVDHINPDDVLKEIESFGGWTLHKRDDNLLVFSFKSSKTISVTDEVYELLSHVKLPNESFGDTIKRLCLEKSANSLYMWVQSQDLWSDMNIEEKKVWDEKIGINPVYFSI
jgi:ubiquinone/menaquinone biosynthesis C-methylase UbiE